MAFTHVHITLQHLGLSDDHAMLFDRLASRVFGADASCISPDDLARNTLGQPNLWGYGISGDLPIVLVRVTEAAAIPLVRQLLHAQEYWRVKGLRADVVILNEHPAEYLDETQQFLDRGRAGAAVGRLEQRHGGMFLLRADGMPDADRHLLSRGRARRRCAAISADSRRSSIVRRRGCIRATTCRPRRRSGSREPPRRRCRVAAARPRERRRRLHARRPRIRHRARRRSRDAAAVVERDGQPEFGTMVSASGSAFTWAGNSRENRLTPFANDPIADPTGEAIYLRDDDSGEVWGATPGPLPRRADGGRWVDSARRRRDAVSACRRGADAASSRCSSRPTTP